MNYLKHGLISAISVVLVSGLTQWVNAPAPEAKTITPVPYIIIEIHDEETPAIDEPVVDEYTREFSQEEIDLLARVVMSEVGVESFEVKQALAEVIINRLDSDFEQFANENTLEDVIRAGQFSTQDNGEPSEDCYRAVYAAIEYDAFPDDMLWARADYVDWGYEYTIDRNSITKFSTVNNYQGEN